VVKDGKTSVAGGSSVVTSPLTVTARTAATFLDCQKFMTLTGELS